jgi:hypothetical protein
MEQQKREKRVPEPDLDEASDQQIHCGAVENRVVLQHAGPLGQELEQIQRLSHVDFSSLHLLANVVTRAV